jgi:hypothetical protein
VAVAVAQPEPELALPALRVAVFRDDDADAYQGEGEPGLAGLRVQVLGHGGRSEAFAADAMGVVTVTLPGPGTYTVRLADQPGEDWEATTRVEIEIWVKEDGSVVLLPPPVGAALPLPVGAAEGVAFAFGLTAPVAQEAALWLPLAVAGLLLLTALTALADRRAAAIRSLEHTLGGEL